MRREEKAMFDRANSTNLHRHLLNFTLAEATELMDGHNLGQTHGQAVGPDDIPSDAQIEDPTPTVDENGAETEQSQTRPASSISGQNSSTQERETCDILHDPMMTIPQTVGSFPPQLVPDRSRIVPMAPVDPGAPPPITPTPAAAPLITTPTSTVHSLPDTNRSDDTFSPLTEVRFLGPSNERARNKKVPIIVTAISGSGKTFAVIREKSFLIYKLTPNGTPSIVGRMDSNGDWRYGLDERAPKIQAAVMNNITRYRFRYAAINDNILVGGLTGSGRVLMFSISENDPGKFICQGATDGGVVHMIFFNRQGTEVAVVHTLPSRNEESWRFWKVSEQAARVWDPKYTGDLRLPSDQHLSLQMKFQTGDKGHLYATRDAKFSQTGDKVVACTNHSHGTSLVTILSKNEQGRWASWGSRQIRVSVHIWDEGCLGFMGVDL